MAGYPGWLFFTLFWSQNLEIRYMGIKGDCIWKFGKFDYLVPDIIIADHYE